MIGNSIEPLTTENIFDSLSKILQQGKKHPFVRKAVVTAICTQLHHSCIKETSPYLQAVLAKFTRYELDEIIKTLTKIYLQQRENLKNGDSEIEVNGQQYQVWIDSERPQTDIEQVMLDWLRNEKYPIAQQVSTQAFIDFAKKLEQEEEKRINQIKNKQHFSQERIDSPYYSTNSRSSHQPLQDFYLSQIVTRFATIKAPIYQQSISNLLPQVWRNNLHDQESMNFVLRRWYQASHGEIKNISERLSSGLFWSKYLGLLLFTGGIFQILIGVIAVNTMNTVINKLLARNGSTELSSPAAQAPSNPNNLPATPTLSNPNNSPNSSVRIYNSDKIPVGSYSYYERNFKKEVSYIRQDNELIGAMYDSQQPNIIACFTANISENQVIVEWWGDLELINRPGKKQDTNEYSIKAFTVDNVKFRSGLDNSLAVEQCQNNR